MKELHTECIINAPPADVRLKLLHFVQWDTWNPMMNQVQCEDGRALQVGDKLTLNFIVLNNYVNTMTIAANDPEEFAWVDKLGMAALFRGRHYFRFESVDEGSRTRFVHGEVLSGALVPIYFLMTDIQSLQEVYEETTTAFKRFAEGA